MMLVALSQALSEGWLHSPQPVCGARQHLPHWSIVRDEVVFQSIVMEKWTSNYVCTVSTIQGISHMSFALL